MSKKAVWAALATVALSLPLAATASASPVVEAPLADDIAASRAFMTEYGVPESVQDELIALTLAGGLPLSDVEGAVPESVERVESSSSSVDVSRYADGSISVVEVEKPAASSGITPFGISGCSFSSGSGYASYTNCKVHYQSTVFSFGFYANFSIAAGANNDRITWAGSKYLVYSIGHLLTSSSVWVEQSVETASRDASAVYTATFDLWPGVGSVTRGTRLFVGDNTYWQDNGW